MTKKRKKKKERWLSFPLPVKNDIICLKNKLLRFTREKIKLITFIRKYENNTPLLTSYSFIKFMGEIEHI